jgi:hypothetical protein
MFHNKTLENYSQIMDELNYNQIDKMALLDYFENLINFYYYYWNYCWAVYFSFECLELMIEL